MLILLTVNFGFAQKSLVKERDVRANLEFLASDAMQGRGSGTQFEHITARYLGSLMQQFGIEPAGDKLADGTMDYVQTVEVTGRSFLQEITLHDGSGGTLKPGADFLILSIAEKQFSGELQKRILEIMLKRGRLFWLTPQNRRSLPIL